MFQRTSWGATVGTAIALQWLVVLSMAVLAMFWSSASAKSLLAGGAAVALPNAALALWLTLRMSRTGSAGAYAMMMGEMVKLCLTLALLVVATAQLKPDLVFLALLIGVVGALKAQWLALWVTRKY